MKLKFDSGLDYQLEAISSVNEKDVNNKYNTRSGR